MPPLPSVPTYNIAMSRRFASPPSVAAAARDLRVNRQQSSQSSTDSSLLGESDSSEDEEEFQQQTPPSSDNESTSIPKQKDTQMEIQPYYSSPSDDTSMGHASEALLPISSLANASSFALAFQLHRMYNSVLACQESMWEVLNDRIRNREEELKRLGWNDEDLEAVHARPRFEKLLERYQG